MKGQLQCSCGCGMTPKSTLINILDKIEKMCGFELVITSCARCEKHNTDIGASKNSAHTLGLAVDIHYENSNQLYLLEKAIFSIGIRRTGLSQKNNFRHIDIASGSVPNPKVGGILEYPQDVDWKY